MVDADAAVTRYKGWSVISWELEYGAIFTLNLGCPMGYPEDQPGLARCIFSRLSRVRFSNFVNHSVIKEIEQYPKDNGVTLHRIVLEGDSSFIEAESVQVTRLEWQP
jgi:hypothetical protein